MSWHDSMSGTENTGIHNQGFHVINQGYTVKALSIHFSFDFELILSHRIYRNYLLLPIFCDPPTVKLCEPHGGLRKTVLCSILIAIPEAVNSLWQS